MSQIYLTMIGRKQDDDIVQEGRGAAGHLVRWSFSEITPQSFRWRSQVSVDEGATWRLNVEFFDHRAESA